MNYKNCTKSLSGRAISFPEGPRKNDEPFPPILLEAIFRILKNTMIRKLSQPIQVMSCFFLSGGP